MPEPDGSRNDEQGSEDTPGDGHVNDYRRWGAGGLYYAGALSQTVSDEHPIGMGILAVSPELWSVVGVSITVLLLVPGRVYAWLVLEGWIGDGDSYSRVIASIDSTEAKPVPLPDA